VKEPNRDGGCIELYCGGARAGAADTGADAGSAGMFFLFGTWFDASKKASVKIA
jgi:hypothetical protein